MHGSTDTKPRKLSVLGPHHNKNGQCEHLGFERDDPVRVSRDGFVVLVRGTPGCPPEEAHCQRGLRRFDDHGLIPLVVYVLMHTKNMRGGRGDQ